MVVQAGWKQETAGKHGRVYPPGFNGAFIGHSLSPSDPYAANMFKKDVRKFCAKHGLDNPFEETLQIRPNWAKDTNIPVPERRPLLNEPINVKPPGVPLNDGDFEMIADLRRSGKDYGAIVKILEAQNRLSATGKPLQKIALVQWMLKRGFRQRTRFAQEPKRSYTKKNVAAMVDAAMGRPEEVKAPAPTVPPVAPLNTKAHPFLTEFLEIISSNLNDDVKERMLRLSAKALVNKEDV